MRLLVKLPYNYEPTDCGISPQSSIETLQRFMASKTSKVSVAENSDDYYLVNYSNDYGVTLDDKYTIFATRFGLI